MHCSANRSKSFQGKHFSFFVICKIYINNVHLKLFGCMYERCLTIIRGQAVVVTDTEAILKFATFLSGLLEFTAFRNKR